MLNYQRVFFLIFFLFGGFQSHGGYPYPHSQESTCAAMPGMGCCHRQHVLGPWDIGTELCEAHNPKQMPDCNISIYFL